MFAIKSFIYLEMKSGDKEFDNYWNGSSFGSLAIAKLYSTYQEARYVYNVAGLSWNKRHKIVEIDKTFSTQTGSK